MFEQTKFFIIDMDGTFYLSGKLLPGSPEFIEKLLKSGKDYRFFTNNSSNNVEVCREKLAKMGFPVDEDRVIISSHVTIDYLNRVYSGNSVYLLGNERLTEDFIKGGIELDDKNPDIVVLGFDTTLTYEKIHKAARFIAGGAVYIATHPDFNCPTADGFMPDTGSMIELFAASTGRRPLIMGKPSPVTVDYLCSKLSCQRDELAFVGDRLETDIAIGARLGIPCALVLTGVTSREQYQQQNIRADVVAERLAEIQI